MFLFILWWQVYHIVWMFCVVLGERWGWGDHVWSMLKPRPLFRLTSVDAVVEWKRPLKTPIWKSMQAKWVQKYAQMALYKLNVWYACQNCLRVDPWSMAFGVDMFEHPVLLVLLYFAALSACDMLLSVAKLLLCCDCILFVIVCCVYLYYCHCNACLLVRSQLSKTVPCRRWIQLQPQISRPRCWVRLQSWHVRLQVHGLLTTQHVGVSMAMGVPNSWMVYQGKPQSKMDDLWVPQFMETPMWIEGQSTTHDQSAWRGPLYLQHHRSTSRWTKHKQIQYCTMNITKVNQSDWSAKVFTFWFVKCSPVLQSL